MAGEETFLGIDPGASGGIAVINRSGGVLTVLKMPETERDVWDAVRYDAVSFAVIEIVHAMPKQGVSSSFKFGKSYGYLRGCLVASATPFEGIRPHLWQKELRCLTRGDKNVSKRKAQELFPDVKVIHATADALLLAEYARRLWLKRNGGGDGPW